MRTALTGILAMGVLSIATAALRDAQPNQDPNREVGPARVHAQEGRSQKSEDRKGATAVRSRTDASSSIFALRASDFAQPSDARGDEPAGYYTDEELAAMDIPLYAEGTVAGQDSSCQTIGAFNEVFPSFSPNRFRGNFYRITFGDVRLLEIRQQLQITSTTAVQLRFSIHRAPSVLVDDPQTDAVFQRVRPDIIRDVVGTGEDLAYSSGSFTPLVLESGFDYLIGVAWSSTAVSYGRELPAPPWPLPFVHGMVIGNANINTFPLPDEQLEDVSTVGGAYAMELCFEPVAGACCNAAADPPQCDGTLLESQCAAPGSFFFGERTTCAGFGGNCLFGACCGPCGDGDCNNNFARPACDDDGGVWAGEGLTCTPGLCTPVLGACCDGATCTETCRDECLQDPNRSYLGDGTRCFPNMCAGACCVSGTTFQGCLNLTRSVCGFANGTFKGEGTTCASLTPEQECGGACCDQVLGCLSVSRRADCIAAAGLFNPVYRGDARTCGGEGGVDCADGEESGACCFPNGTCFITTRSACQNGSFTAGATSCTGIQCQTVCCVPGQACRITPGTAACTDPTVGGFVLDGRTTCVPDFCGQPPGACCFADAASCEDGITFEECRLLEGRFVEGEGDCSALCPVLGACCRPNGSCSDLVTADECTILTGEEGGLIAGEDCPPPGGCEALGACCTAEGSCTLELEDDCETAGGFFAGAETTCGPSACPTGACCGGEECVEVIEPACTADFRGDDTTCDDPEVFQCAGPGACCLNVDVCTALSPFECSINEGSYQGEGVACGPEVCPAAACCLPGECRDDLFPLECQRLGGRAFPGETCDEGACEDRGACCFRDGTCDDAVRQSECETGNGAFTPDTLCADLEPPCEAVGACCRVNGTCENDVPGSLCTGNDLFTPDTDCDVLDPPCERRGSCCLRTGECNDLVAESQCVADNGSFSFRSTCQQRTDCEPIGACCFRNGQCDENRTASGCAAANGFLSPDMTCAQIDPPCAPRGACCVGVECRPDQREIDCAFDDGGFQGAETLCPPDAMCGACCELAGNCNSPMIPDHCDPDTARFEPGQFCTDFECEPRGACCVPEIGCVEERTRTECETDMGGTYDGDATVCRLELCDPGACCVLIEMEPCLFEVTRQQCEQEFAQDGGVYVAADLTCEDEGVDCTRGICCSALGECIENTVVSACEVPEDFRPGEACTDCAGRGACCVEGVCQPDVTETQCGDQSGTYAGDGTICEPDDLCTLGACCLPGGECDDSGGRLDCDMAGGDYRGPGLTCTPDACNLIAESIPPNCTIDARQPFEPEGMNPTGFTLIEITFESDLAAAPMIEDFDVTTDPGAAAPPVITAVGPGGDAATVVLTLDEPIPPGEWTCFEFLPSASVVCIGNLPGDVDGSEQVADPAEVAFHDDVEAALVCIVDQPDPPCELSQCDADDSGECRLQDALRFIDLANRVLPYDRISRTLPPCPTPAP